MFTTEKIEGLEWLQFVTESTPQNEFNVSITWVLDRYRIFVLKPSLGCRMQVKDAHYQRTAVATANKFLRAYAKREAR